jgi:drug/metabolite transporter (DMT)-like permease
MTCCFLAAAHLPIHLLFPLASSVLYVAAALSLRRAAEQGAGLWRSTFVMNIGAAVCFVPLLLGSPGPGPCPIWQPASIAALFIVAQTLTMVALNRGDVSVATPVMGTKVLFVAALVTLLVGEPIVADYWVSSGMSAAGIALLSLRGKGEPRPPHHHLPMTISAALAAAACYALFDVLVRKWSPAWGVSRLLPAIMGLAAVMSLALLPLFEGPLRRIPGSSGGPLLLGSLLLGIQALLLVRTLGLYPDTTRINIVYNTRGLWSIVAVWLVGHWWENSERHAGRTTLIYRTAGAALLLGAIIIAVTHPFSGRRPG